jgi:hypothetical protein
MSVREGVRTCVGRRSGRGYGVGIGYDRIESKEGRGSCAERRAQSPARSRGRLGVDWLGTLSRGSLKRRRFGSVAKEKAGRMVVWPPSLSGTPEPPRRGVRKTTSGYRERLQRAQVHVDAFKMASESRMEVRRQRGFAQSGTKGELQI